MPFYLQLGRLHDLSLLETKNLFGEFKPVTDQADLIAVELEETQLIEQLEKSGGLVKALKQLAVVRLDKEAMISEVVNVLKNDEKPTFALSLKTTQPQSFPTVKEIKTALKELSISSRFVESRGEGLPPAIWIHQPVREIVLIHQGEEVIVTETIWMQNIDDWSFRDYDKPKRDHARGMLPPKLARMMVNFISPELQAQPNKKLYDPFCGMSTVLMEAQLVGWDAYGSDISQEAIHHSAENMHWFSQHYQKPEVKRLFVADATTVKLSDLGEKVDAIVTEPFLGKQQPQPTQLANMFKGLEKLYWGALKNWTHLLKDGGEVVVVTPLVVQGKTQFSLEQLIDKSRELGYTVASGPLIYSRPQTITQRAIYVLKFNQK